MQIRAHKTRRPPPSPVRGVAAVEFALLVPLLLVLLALPLYLGRYTWHYTAAQVAATNAARYMSAIPVAELTNPYRAPAVANVAYQIVDAHLIELAPGPFAPSVLVQCDNTHCIGASKPRTVTVNVQIIVRDVFFPTMSRMSMTATVKVTYPYLGR